MKAIRNPFIVTILTICLLAIVTGYSDLFTREITYTGKEDHSITLAEASQLTHNFRKNAPWDVIGGYFGKDAVSAILNQEGAVGVRYYYGMDEQGVPHIVLIGVGSDGNDMTDGLLAERAGGCPPFCADENVLNSPESLKQISSSK